MEDKLRDKTPKREIFSLINKNMIYMELKVPPSNPSNLYGTRFCWHPNIYIVTILSEALKEMELV